MTHTVAQRTAHVWLCGVNIPGISHNCTRPGCQWIVLTARSSTRYRAALHVWAAPQSVCGYFRRCLGSCSSYCSTSNSNSSSMDNIYSSSSSGSGSKKFVDWGTSHRGDARVCHAVRAAVSCALMLSVRRLIVPRQLKAYGHSFSQSIGERADHLAGHCVLQSLSPSRTRQHSPLLAKPVKTTGPDSFEDMLLCPALQAALREMQITSPSPIQQTAVEAILQRRHTLIAAPHGEGKTLAFLLPLFQLILHDRDVYRIPLREHRPRALLLAPTRELVRQLHAVCQVLQVHTGVTSVCFTGCKRANYTRSRRLKQCMPDVVLLDPKLALRLIRARRLSVEDLRYLVVDEADAMLSCTHDHDAMQLLMKAMRRVQYRYLWPVQTQFIFSSAYVTRSLEHALGTRWGGELVTCMHRHAMHRPAGRGGGSLLQQHRFLPVARRGEMLTVLMHVLRKHGHCPCTEKMAMTTESDTAGGGGGGGSSSSSSGGGVAGEVFVRHTLRGSWDEWKEKHAWGQGGIGDGVCARTDGAMHNTGAGLGGRAVMDQLSSGEQTGRVSVDTDAGCDVRCCNDASCSGGGEAIDQMGTAASVRSPGEAPSPAPPRHVVDYAHDWAARTILEGLRPVHWAHVRTLAAPFTCPVPRTIFDTNAKYIKHYIQANARTNNDTNDTNDDKTRRSMCGDGAARAILFAPNIDTATAIYHQLRQAGFAVSLLHASLPLTVRRDMYTDFCSGKTALLCATDVAARGLDIPVHLILNWGVPSNALTYLSRAGRASRMGRVSKVYTLYCVKDSHVIVAALRAFLRTSAPLDGVLSNRALDYTQPRYAEWRTHRLHALSRAYVSMITTKAIPAHLERVYVRHNATWRPIYHPRGVGSHAGVPPRQQSRVMESVMRQAVSFRRGQLARRKGGAAKFGARRLGRGGVWNDVGGTAAVMSAVGHGVSGGAGIPQEPPV